MRIENITHTVATPVFKNTNENDDNALKKRGNQTAGILLSLSGLATLGLAGAGIAYDKKSSLKIFNEVVREKGICFKNGVALLNNEKFSGKIKYLTNNNLVKTRIYKNGLLSGVDTQRKNGVSTRLLLERNNSGKITSFVLKRLELCKKLQTIHTKKVCDTV